MKKEDKQSSSLLLILSTAMQMKQNLLQILRNQEKYNIKFIGDMNKIQCHLSTAQDAGQAFPLLRTSLCHKNASYRLSAKVERELFARQLTPRERPKVTLRPSWVDERSNTVSMPRETESDLQTWDCNPNASESRKWPKRTSNSPSISKSTASPTTRPTRTSKQYLQRIAEQVQKLMVTKEIIRRRLTKGQHSQ